MHEIEISIFCEQVICVYCLFSIFCIVCGLDGKKAKWVLLQLSGGYYWFVQPGPDLVQGHCPALPLNWGLMMTAGAGDRRHWPPLWWWLLTCMCLSEIDLRRNIPEVLRNWRTGFESSAPQRVFVILVSWSWLSQPSAGHSTPPPHHSPACRDRLLTLEVDISSEKSHWLCRFYNFLCKY